MCIIEKPAKNVRGFGQLVQIVPKVSHSSKNTKHKAHTQFYILSISLQAASSQRLANSQLPLLSKLFLAQFCMLGAHITHLPLAAAYVVALFYFYYYRKWTRCRARRWPRIIKDVDLWCVNNERSECSRRRITSWWLWRQKWWLWSSDIFVRISCYSTIDRVMII